MFTKRLLSGIILIIMALFFVLGGGIYLWTISLLISLVGLYELFRALDLRKKSIAYVIYVWTVIYYIFLLFDLSEQSDLVWIFALLSLLMTYVIRFPKYKTEDITLAFFALFYVPVLFSYVYLTRMMPSGQYLVWLIFLASWGSDTSAYAFGMLFGKHKIAPKLSPKKSLEGCIGGIVGAAVMGGIYGLAFAPHMTAVPSPVISCTLACMVGSIISQMGDLAASAIKRNHDIKDYGDLIPGHGGVLDRFDSMLFTAPAIYFSLDVIMYFL